VTAAFGVRNGALLRLARRHRLAVPTHSAFHQIIRIMEPR